MDTERFDGLTRALGQGATRRRTLGVLAGLAGFGLTEVAAKRRKRKGKDTKRAAAQANDRTIITICHNPGTPQAQTMVIPRTELNAHVRHGDTIGPCPCTPATCQSLNACGPNVSDGCGGTLRCLCGLTSTPTCNNGTCTTCSAVCTNGCSCANLTDGTTQCTSVVVSGCPRLCTTNAECRTDEVCLSTITSAEGENFTFCGTTTGVCATVGRCNR